MTTTLNDVKKLAIGGLIVMALLTAILMMSTGSKQLSLPGFDTGGQTQNQTPCPDLDYAKLGKQIGITRRMIENGQAPYSNYSSFLLDAAQQAGIENPYAGVSLVLLDALSEVYKRCH